MQPILIPVSGEFVLDKDEHDVGVFLQIQRLVKVQQYLPGIDKKSSLYSRNHFVLGVSFSDTWFFVIMVNHVCSYPKILHILTKHNNQQNVIDRKLWNHENQFPWTTLTTTNQLTKEHNKSFPHHRFVLYTPTNKLWVVILKSPFICLSICLSVHVPCKYTFLTIQWISMKLVMFKRHRNS